MWVYSGVCKYTTFEHRKPWWIPNTIWMPNLLLFPVSIDKLYGPYSDIITFANYIIFRKHNKLQIWRILIHKTNFSEKEKCVRIIKMSELRPHSDKRNSITLMLSKILYTGAVNLRKWTIMKSKQNTIIYFLDIIQRPVFNLKQRFRDWNLPLSSDKRSTQFCPIVRSTPYLRNQESNTRQDI
jgi:hypothetical protein